MGVEATKIRVSLKPNHERMLASAPAEISASIKSIASQLQDHFFVGTFRDTLIKDLPNVDPAAFDKMLTIGALKCIELSPCFTTILIHDSLTRCADRMLADPTPERKAQYKKQYEACIDWFSKYLKPTTLKEALDAELEGRRQDIFHQIIIATIYVELHRAMGTPQERMLNGLTKLIRSLGGIEVGEIVVEAWNLQAPISVWEYGPDEVQENKRRITSYLDLTRARGFGKALARVEQGESHGRLRVDRPPSEEEALREFIKPQKSGYFSYLAKLRLMELNSPPDSSAN